MHDEHMQSLCDSLEFAYRDLAKVNQQIRNAGGDISPSSNEYMDRLTHTIKSLETTKAMKAAEDERGDRGGYGMTRMGGYPGRYYPGSMYPVGGYRDGYPEGGYRDGDMRGEYRDGYGRNMDRDSQGRYADVAGMREKLRDMMANTRDERTRQDLQRMVDSMA
jgi:hypothetical protein